MLSKTIKYEDWNGLEREETFYFNLSESELMELEMTTPGGFANYLQTAVNKKDAPTLMAAFKMLIMKSYGEKSEDGKRFKKSPELAEAFIETTAYDQLFIELVTDADKAAAFVNGIVPKKLTDKVNSPEIQAQLKNHPALKMK